MSRQAASGENHSVENGVEHCAASGVWEIADTARRMASGTTPSRASMRRGTPRAFAAFVSCGVRVGWFRPGLCWA